jgi:hypothetical protein
MACKCFNPQCDHQAGFFGAGALYILQEKTRRSRRHTQYLWLCDSCALKNTLRTDGAGKAIVMSRSQVLPFKAEDGVAQLRLVFRSKRVPMPVGGIRGINPKLSNKFAANEPARLWLPPLT